MSCRADITPPPQPYDICTLAPVDVLTQGLANKAPSDRVHHMLAWGVLIMDASHIPSSVYDETVRADFRLCTSRSPKRLQEAFSSSTLLRARHPSSRPWVALNKILTAFVTSFHNHRLPIHTRRGMGLLLPPRVTPGVEPKLSWVKEGPPSLTRTFVWNVPANVLANYSDCYRGA